MCHPKLTSMQPSRKSQDEIIHKSLKENGYIVPTHEDDVEAFLESLKDHEIPPLPEHLNDPGSILDAPPKTTKIIQLQQQNPQKDIRNYAMAARDGKQISESTMEKMKRHLADAKKKK